MWQVRSDSSLKHCWHIVKYAGRRQCFILLIDTTPQFISTDKDVYQDLGQRKAIPFFLSLLCFAFEETKSWEMADAAVFEWLRPRTVRLRVVKDPYTNLTMSSSSSSTETNSSRHKIWNDEQRVSATWSLRYFRAMWNASIFELQGRSSPEVKTLSSTFVPRSHLDTISSLTY